MPAIQYTNRFKKINQLINQKTTGNPKELAIKLKISERQVFRYIDNLQALGGKIVFNKFINSYEYTADIKLLVKMQGTTC